MKKLFLFSLVSMIFISCEDPDLTDDNPALPEENINLGVSFLYNGMGVDFDSTYTNAQGNKFILTDIKFVVSGFFMLSQGDSFKADDDSYLLYNIENQSNLTMKLPDGGYSGHYGFLIGVDSLVNTDQDVDGLPLTSVLRDPSIARNDDDGYNAMVISGRAIDPTNPDDSVGTIAFEYQLGSLYLSKILKSGQTNFAVTSTTKVNFLLQIDIFDALDNFNIVTRPTLTTDPTDAVDFNLAEDMLGNIKFNLF